MVHARAGKHVIIGALAALSTVSVANAEELTTPLFAGITIGVPLGAAAPAGLYLSNKTLYYSGQFVDGSGRKTGSTFRLEEDSPLLLLSTDFKILGGRYYTFIGQPVEHSGVSSAGAPTSSRWGTFNTIYSPINVSWDLGDGFHVSTGTTIYLPDGTYSVSGVKIANGFTSFEQSFGVSYLKDGWNLTAETNFDFNLINSATNYQSGDVVGVDLTATKTFGKFTVGVGGYLVNQFQNDTLNGVIVGASSFNSPGNRWLEYALGPYVGYNFGVVNVSAWFTQDVYARNTVKAGTGWLRLVVPLGNPLGGTPAPEKIALSERY